MQSGGARSVRHAPSDFFSGGYDSQSIFSSCAAFTVADEAVLSHYG